ncbi:MAG TPA: hypothetical protein VE964_13250 [Myxococcales bacterium]|nr:hypothetical protein [Myxococcales bacterium]
MAHPALIAPADFDPRREEPFRAHLKRVLRDTGFDSWHTYDARRSDDGWPDQVALRLASYQWGDYRLIFFELKVGARRCTPRQWETLWKLAQGQPEVYVWGPENLQHIYDILCARVAVGVSSPTHRLNLPDDHKRAPTPRAQVAYAVGRIGGRVRAR